MSLIPGSVRSPRGGHGNLLQYFYQENPMDRGAWWARSMGLQRVGHDWSDGAWMHALLNHRENGTSCSFISPKSYNPRLSWWLRPGPQISTICCISLTHLCPNSKEASGHLLLFERSDLHWIKICFPIIFWTVVLEKTLKSPVDCKEIQPVHPKGNQS